MMQELCQMSKSAGRTSRADTTGYRRQLSNKQPAVWVLQRQRIAYLEALFQRAPGPGSSRELKTQSALWSSHDVPQAFVRHKGAQCPSTASCYEDTLSTQSSFAISDAASFSSELEDRLLEQALEEWHSLCQSCDRSTASLKRLSFPADLFQSVS